MELEFRVKGVLRLVMCSDFGLGLCYYLVPVWIWRIRFPLLRFSFSFFFFFLARVIGDKGYCSCTVHEQQPKFLTFQPFSAHQWVSCTVHWTHKFYFSITFSTKMGPMALFTYLKIILLQCFQFSVFNFSKISSIQIDPQLLSCQLFKIFYRVKLFVLSKIG